MRTFKFVLYISGISLLLLSCKDSTAKESIVGTISYVDTNAAINRRIIDSLDKYYSTEIQKGFNGSVLVQQKGKIIYERYFGYASKSPVKLLTKSTSTQLSSTSKPFTGTAILWLHQNKYLDINLPVNVYLRDFPYSNITVKMLLEHRSGLPNYTSTGLPRWKTKDFMYNLDLQKYFAMFKPKLLATPDARFRYCNSNFALLARIIEEVSGIPYKQCMKELIFDPLGMKNTFVFDPADDYSNKDISTSYRPNWAVFANTHEDGVYGDKGIYSTVEDMFRWDQSFYTNKILNYTTTKLAYTGNSPDMKGPRDYGLGWRMYDFKTGKKLIYHNGWWHGNNSVFYRFVDENTTVIVLGNKLNNKIYDQGKGVYEILRSINPKAFQYTFDEDSDSGEE